MKEYFEKMKRTLVRYSKLAMEKMKSFIRKFPRYILIGRVYLEMTVSRVQSFTKIYTTGIVSWCILIVKRVKKFATETVLPLAEEKIKAVREWFSKDLNISSRKVMSIITSSVLVVAMAFLAIVGVSGRAGLITQKADIVVAERVTVTGEKPFVYDASKAVAAKNKSEMVMIKNDSTGKVSEITDRVTLSGFSNSEEDAVKDSSNLGKIENVNGTEVYERNDSTLYWENLGKDIVYEGEGSKDVPVELQVKYYLDGKEKKADEIKGKSGHVKIEISYVNKTSGQNFVPYSATSILSLEKEYFTNIETNGTAVESGFNLMIYNISFPGLQADLSQYAGTNVSLGLNEKFVIEADAEDFALGNLATIVTNGTFSNLDDNKINSVSSIGDFGYLLGGFSNQLLSGASSLCSGLGLFSEGLSALSEGSEEFTYALGEYAEGISALRDGLGEITDKVSFMPDVSEALKNTQNLLDFLIAYIKSLLDNSACLDNAIENSNEVGDEETAEELKALQTAITDTENLESITETLVELLEQASKWFQGGYEKIGESYGGLKSAEQGAAELEEASEQLKDAQTALDDGISELKNQSNGLVDGGTALRNGAAQFSNEINSSGRIYQAEVIAAVSERIRQLKEIDSKSHSYSGSDSKTKVSTTYMFQTEF